MRWRVAFKVHEILGRPTAWLAAGYREGTPLERACIWPAWAVARCLSTTAYVTAMWLVRDV